MTIEDVIREAEGFEGREFAGPVSDAVVAAASQELGLAFPPQCAAFLRTFGAGSVASESFVGLGGPRHLDVVWLTRVLRARKSARLFPVSLVPVRSDGFGNYDCIDTTQLTSDGEFAIIEWAHDRPDAEPNHILATTYFEWFVLILQMVREVQEMPYE
jgi:hypothetical protein